MYNPAQFNRFFTSQTEEYDGILDGMLDLLPLGEKPKRFVRMICKIIIKGLSMKYILVEKVVSMRGLTCQLCYTL